MLYRVWIIFAVFMCSNFAYGLNLKDSNYDIYVGDVNNDGYSDFYFSGKPLILILHGDIDTPIPIFPGNFLVSPNASGDYIIQSYQLDATTLSQYIDAGILRLGAINNDYFIWTNGSADQTNILLRGAISSSPSLILANFSGPLLPLLAQTIPANQKANISDRDIPISLMDVNGDGKMDILMGAYLYQADSTGIPASTPKIASQATATVMSFTYDPLGRLTFATDSKNGNRDYDYDKAGNRLLVSTNTATDATAEPAPESLPAPTNLQYFQAASSAWKATWNSVIGATKYLVTDTSGSSQYVTTTEAYISCPISNPSSNKPRSVQACNASNVCGTTANFN